MMNADKSFIEFLSFLMNVSWVVKHKQIFHAFRRNASCKAMLLKRSFVCMLLPAILFIPANYLFAQDKKPFWNEIETFKKEDSIVTPKKNSILFVGSSSFRLWTNMQDYFPKHAIINRGFGGSSLLDVIRYEKEIIFKYKPKQIVIYAGENDLASSDTVTALMVLKRFQTLFTNIRKVMPNVPLMYVSIKPSPSRWRLKEKMIEANKLIKKFLRTKKKTAFADVWPLMLDGDGKPNEALFLEDKLHINAEGYAIWAKVLDRYLKRP